VSDVHASQIDRKLTREGWFTEQMPCFNEQNRYVADYLVQVSKWWVEYAGVNGFRQDTYPYNDFAFMQRWCREMEAEYPGMNIVGETWVNDNVGVSYWQKDSKVAAPLNSGLPTVMDFPLAFLIGRAVDEETDDWFNGLARLHAYVAQDGVYADVNHLMTFLSNHDIDRFQPTEEAAQNLVRYQQALTLLLTLRGIPQLYVGDEIGMYAQKSDNDGLLRQDFPGGFPRDKQNAFTAEGRTDLQNAYFNFTRKLLHWRRNNLVVAYGKLVHFAVRNGCYVYARQWEGQTVTVLINGTSQAQTLDLSMYREVLPARRAFDLISEKTVRLATRLTLERRAMLVLAFGL
jgi:glycosidase